MKSCIIYYSHSGHTRRLAEQIAKETHGDLLELIPEIPYPQDYSTVVAQAKKELQQKVRPKLKTRVPDLSTYDMLFIGTPNWWSSPAPPVLTFLEQTALHGIPVAPLLHPWWRRIRAHPQGYGKLRLRRNVFTGIVCLR